MSSNPQQQAVELIAAFFAVRFVDSVWAPHLDRLATQLAARFADAGLLCSSPDVQPQEEDGSLRSEPSAVGQGRVWTHDDLEPRPPVGENYPVVVDKYGVRWVGDERQDGFEGWRSDSHGFTVWRTWFDLAFNRGPLHEVSQ